MSDRPYYDLPFLDEINQPACTYGPCAALRAPIREAVNRARHLDGHAMEQVILLLEHTLDHISTVAEERRRPKPEPEEVPDEATDDAADADDPLERLLRAS